MKCPSCNTEQATGLYCSNCGTKLISDNSNRFTVFHICDLCGEKITDENEKFRMFTEKGPTQYWHKKCAEKEGYDTTKESSGWLLKDNLNKENNETKSNEKTDLVDDTQLKTSKDFQKKCILAIGALIALIFIVINVNNHITQERFESSLETYLSKELLKDVEYFKDYTLSGWYGSKLNITFEDNFDDLTNQQIYNKLSYIMHAYENKRDSLSREYNLTERILGKGVESLPDIYAYTSNDKVNKYEYSSTDTFTDKDGEIYFKGEMNPETQKPVYNSGNNSNSGSYSVSSLSSSEKIDAWVAAQIYIENKLKSPSTAKFPWFNEDYVKVQNGKIVVTAYVDAENSYGAKLRVAFTCTMDSDYNLIDAILIE